VRIRKRTKKKKLTHLRRAQKGLLFIDLNMTLYLQYVKTASDWMSRCYTSVWKNKVLLLTLRHEAKKSPRKYRREPLNDTKNKKTIRN
jgi:hypothetical protein